MTRFTAATKKTEIEPKKVTRKKAEEKPVEYMGLCMTCIHTGSCGFRRDVSQAVLECDEFDIGPTPEPQTFSAAEKTVSEAKPSVEFKGLCINCDVRQTCTFQKPAEGVWHCEEYV